MSGKREYVEEKGKIGSKDKKKRDVPPSIESVYDDHLPHGRALNRWDAEAERDLIMACLTSENNNYPTINWPRVKLIMDDRGYKFSRSALDQRWSKKIMKDWRDHKGPGAMTDFVDPNTANNTPARKRGRIEAVKQAKENQAISDNARNRTRATVARAARDPGHATRNLAHLVFGNRPADADDIEDMDDESKKFTMQPRQVSTVSDQKYSKGEVGDAKDLVEQHQHTEDIMDDIVGHAETDYVAAATGEPPKKRRTRRTKAEMEQFRAEKLAARILREKTRAEKIAAKGAKKVRAIKQEPNHTAVEASTPFNPSAAPEIMVDLSDMPLFPGAANNSSPAINATSSAGGSSSESTSAAQPTPMGHIFNPTQQFHGVITYQPPAAQAMGPSFQNGVNSAALQSPGFPYQLTQQSFAGRGMAQGYMMGQYGQAMPMSTNDFNYGMQPGYAQHAPYAYVPDHVYSMPHVYADQGAIDRRLQSDARVIFDGVRITDLGAVQCEPQAEKAPKQQLSTEAQATSETQSIGFQLSIAKPQLGAMSQSYGEPGDVNEALDMTEHQVEVDRRSTTADETPSDNDCLFMIN